MNFSILLPHYRTGKISAYTISQLLKYKGNHEIEIIVIDNNIGDGSADYLQPFAEHFTYLPYPKDRQQQSHGCAFDYALELGYIHNEHFITIESDSFPVRDNWLDYYENLVNKGFDCAGSLLKLSGGNYVHPAGTMFKKSIFDKANEYCKNIEYDYFPNMGVREGFDCHIMLKKSKVDRILEHPEDYMELAKSYQGLTKDEMLAKKDFYRSVCGVFHNGMGKFQESIKTFGLRDTNSGKQDVLFDNKEPIIYRIGYEPGQYFCYWQLAMGKNIALIPTEIKWMRNRGGQQQEYTLNEAGFKHIWGVSAYHKAKMEGFEDIINFKENQVEELYNSLPDNQKI